MILCDTRSIVKHLRRIHNIARYGPKRPTISSQRVEKDWTQVSCQRFFASGHQSTCFTVLPPEESRRRQIDATHGLRRQGLSLASKGQTEADLVHAEAFHQLFSHRKAMEATKEVVNMDFDRTEVSPWLQLTRWSTCLDGHSLCDDVARSADLPQKTSEPLLRSRGARSR
jgi:hypothetical protein